MSGPGRRARLVAGTFFCVMGAIFVTMGLLWADGASRILLVAVGGFLASTGIFSLLSARKSSEVFPEERPREDGSTLQQLNRPLPVAAYNRLSLLFVFLPMLAVVGFFAIRQWRAQNAESDTGRSSQSAPPPRPEDVPQLIAQLKDPLGRLSAIARLALLGSAARDAVPALSEILSDKKLYLERVMAARTLGRIGADTPGVVPALCNALKDDAFDVQSMAIDALAGMGPQAKDALPALNRLKDAENPIVAEAAAAAVAIIEGRGEVLH